MIPLAKGDKAGDAVTSICWGSDSVAIGDVMGEKDIIPSEVVSAGNKATRFMRRCVTFWQTKALPNTRPSKAVHSGIFGGY
jgi:hypothetical protein